MKAKHLLFSSLFLSMGFAACTNEVEEFSTQQNPTEAAKGIELGEGFKINVAYGGAEVDADTRAALERNETNTGWKASWTQGDKLGAAMYAMVTSRYPSNHERAGEVSQVFNYFGSGNPNVYASNNEFAYGETESGGSVFTSASNSMVGAYMLYYPYNEALNELAAIGKKIPVYFDEEKADYNLKFNVGNIGEEVSKRIVAADLVYFYENGNQTPKFTVKQIPNLYMIKFSIDDENLLKFDKPMTINQVIVEAEGAGQTKVINTNGTITPSKETPNNDDLNYNGKTIEGISYGLGYVKFDPQAEEDQAESLIIDITYPDEASKEGYQITETGDVTLPIYFSALPTETPEKVTFTIIAEVDGFQKVYSKTYQAGWKYWDDATDAEGNVTRKGLPNLMTGQGETINLKVVLDTEDNVAGKIYTEEQFLAAYNAGATEFIFAKDMELDDFVVNKDVNFYGKKVTVKDIKSKFTAENEMEVLGDVIAEGKAITFKNFVTICGKVEAKTVVKGDASLAGVINFEGEDSENGSAAITGDVSVEGAGSQINAKKKITAANVAATAGAAIDLKDNAIVANVTAENSSVSFAAASAATVKATSATVSFAKATLSGTVTATESNVTFGGGSTMPGITASKTELELNGKVNGDATVTECSGVKGIAEITGKLALVSSTTDKNSQINAVEINVDLNSAFNAKALTAGTMDVYGIATATGVNTIETLNVQPNAEVTLTGKSVKTSYVKNANVNKNETTGKYGILNINKNLPLQTLTNNGEVNATEATIVGGSNNANIYGSFTVTGEFNQNMIADGTAITVEGENAILNINKTTALESLTNKATVNIASKSELTFTDANNEGTINVTGTLTESVADKLVMSEDAVINALKGATLTMGNGAKKHGTVNVANGTKELKYVSASKFDTVEFHWFKTAAPDDIAKTAINTIIAEEGAILDATAATAKHLIFNGNITLTSNLNFKNNLTVASDVVIKGKQAVKLTLTNTQKGGTQTNLFVIKSGASLTLGDNNVTLAGGTWNHDNDALTPAINSQLIVEDGASFTGNDNEIKNLDIKYNM